MGMTTKQIEELREAAKVATSTLRHHGVEMHPDDILGLVQDVAATLTERSTPESEEEAREVLKSALTEWRVGKSPGAEALLRAASPVVPTEVALAAMLRFAQQSAKPAEGWVCVPRLDRLNSLATHSLGCAIYQRSWAGGGPRCTCGLYETRAMLSASPDRGEG